MDVGRCVVDIREFDRNRIDWCNIIYHNSFFDEKMAWVFETYDAKAIIFDTTFGESKLVCKTLIGIQYQKLLMKISIEKLKYILKLIVIHQKTLMASIIIFGN